MEKITTVESKMKLMCLLSVELFFDENVVLLLHYLRHQLSSGTLGMIFALNEKYIPPNKMPSTETWLIKYNNLQFFRLFRMEKNTFHKLVEILGEVDTKKVLSKSYTGGYYPLDINTHILVFLWYMATQDSLLSIATRFKVCPATVMKVVNKVLYFTLQLKTKYIRFPKSEQEIIDISSGFEKYPGVAGAVDGTHIFIKIEMEQQDSYIDRYRRTSINLMAICDSKTLFSYVFVGYPGSAHDARVLENSVLCREIERHGPNSYFVDDNKYHLLGDSAFGLKTWIMTPYRGDNLTRKQKHHNYCLSSGRVKIEHAFGAYKGRWRRVQYINTYNICKAIEIATAACVLHNFCLLHHDRWDAIFHEAPNVQQHDTERDYDQNRNLEAKLKRDRIANTLFFNR